MSRRIRSLKELVNSFYLNNVTEVQRFAGVPYNKAREIFKTAYKKDKDALGEFHCTEYVRKITVMKIIGMSEQDLIQKMWMLEHPHGK